mmetsp:Transcript_17449/g.16660  ORF Transcript_17449/g.16660 Transcript_17449/m.16660 type:complete len:99 (+) Transcript_17449:731-1027(+)
MEKEKRDLKIKFNPPISFMTTKDFDYKPFLIRNQQKTDDNDGSYFVNPLFVNSTSYGSQYPNWGAKPFEKVKPVPKNMLQFKFKGESNYNSSYFKGPD